MRGDTLPVTTWTLWSLSRVLYSTPGLGRDSPCSGEKLGHMPTYPMRLAAVPFPRANVRWPLRFLDDNQTTTDWCSVTTNSITAQSSVPIRRPGIVIILVNHRLLFVNRSRSQRLSLGLSCRGVNRHAGRVFSLPSLSKRSLTCSWKWMLVNLRGIFVDGFVERFRWVNGTRPGSQAVFRTLGGGPCHSGYCLSAVVGSLCCLRRR